MDHDALMNNVVPAAEQKQKVRLLLKPDALQP